MDFMLELGDDFAFVGRLRRLRIDDSWFRVDLVACAACCSLT
ncbi:YhcG family protein [Salmonella enterica]|nr:YhcG family protein [Salmonella enterica]EIE5432810.1 YhcG family protein [Salmonella enterica]EIE5487800.1 YhcG family protein [Salmonella enterica]EIE5942421.1 YhcG family protein [Salmonella enterica]EJV4615480.1 YhcG family protein [Salmonella enterica]